MSKPTITASVSKESNPTASGSISISYLCNVELNNQHGDDIGDRIDIWKVQSYSWSFSPSSDNKENGRSGSATISNLSAGQKITIQWTVDIEFYHYKAKVTGKDDNGDPILKGEKETDETLSKSGSFSVYTHPGAFTKFNNITAEKTYISDILTAKNVNDWCDHCNKYLNWKNQTASTTANNCKVNSGDFITAAWYNKCARACGLIPINGKDLVKGPYKDNSTDPPTYYSGDLITAERIKALGIAISS